MRREAHYRILSEYFAAAFHGCVVLAHVNAVGTHGARQFGRIVHDEGDAKIAANWHHDCGGATALLVVTFFLAQLDDVDATAKYLG